MNNLREGATLNGGKYKIDRTIAHGGFGITYLAYNQAGEGVVIKEYYKEAWHDRDTTTADITVKESTSDVEGKFRKKFKKEAQTIMRLRHPNIVKVFEFFEEHGTLYYVMEFIDGCSLSDYVKRNGKLSESHSLRLIKKVAMTLGYIHSQNELHLDITPRNIMLTKDGEIKLIDFGVSKHYDDAGDQSTATPVARSKGYAPVEQYLSDGIIKFSPETDIYALAATLYFLLTATTPPDANDRQHLLEEGKELLQIPSALSDNVKKALRFGMYISRKWRIKNTDQFMGTIDGTYVPKEKDDCKYKKQKSSSTHYKLAIFQILFGRKHKENKNIGVHIIASNTNFQVKFYNLLKNYREIVGCGCVLVYCIIAFLCFFMPFLNSNMKLGIFFMSAFLAFFSGRVSARDTKLWFLPLLLLSISALCYYFFNLYYLRVIRNTIFILLGALPYNFILIWSVMESQFSQAIHSNKN